MRELRAAFNRHGRETIGARHTARLGLRNELKDDVTALLLSCGIALNETALSEVALARLKIIEGVANQIKSKLALPEGEQVVATVGV